MGGAESHFKVCFLHQLIYIYAPRRSLIKFFPLLTDYELNRLYKSKTYWAFCYTSTIFTAATQTTSRVESLNAVLKRELINSNTSLVQLNKTINRRHQEEERQKEYAFWKSVIPCV